VDASKGLLKLEAVWQQITVLCGPSVPHRPKDAWNRPVLMVSA